MSEPVPRAAQEVPREQDTIIGFKITRFKKYDEFCALNEDIITSRNDPNDPDECTIVFTFRDRKRKGRGFISWGRHPSCDVRFPEGTPVSAEHLLFFPFEAEGTVMQDVSGQALQINPDHDGWQSGPAEKDVPGAGRSRLLEGHHYGVRMAGYEFEFDIARLEGKAKAARQRQIARAAQAAEEDQEQIAAGTTVKEPEDDDDAPPRSLRSLRRDIYVRVERLAAGGQGEVWKVQRLRDGAVFAAKYAHEGGDPAHARMNVEALENERDRLFRLRHRHIPRFVDSYTQVRDGKTAHVLVMELCEHGTLQDILREARGRGSAVPSEFILAVAAQVASAQRFIARRWIAHRDIKPANLLVKTLGDRPHLLLADFGLSKYVKVRDSGALFGPSFTAPHSLEMRSRRGTKIFMAPEQAGAHPTEAGRGYGRDVDTWALGMILLVLRTTQLGGDWVEGMYQDILDAREKKKGRDHATWKAVMSRVEEALDPDGNPVDALIVDMLCKEAQQRPSPKQVEHRANYLLEHPDGEGYIALDKNDGDDPVDDDNAFVSISAAAVPAEQTYVSTQGPEPRLTPYAAVWPDSDCFNGEYLSTQQQMATPPESRRGQISASTAATKDLGRPDTPAQGSSSRLRKRPPVRDAGDTAGRSRNGKVAKASAAADVSTPAQPSTAAGRKGFPSSERAVREPSGEQSK